MSFPFKLMIIIVSSILIVLVPLHNVPAAKASGLLSTAMQAAGAKPEEWSINGWVKLPSGDLDDEQLAKMVQQSMRELDVGAEEYKLQHKKTKDHNTIQAEVIVHGTHIITIGQVISSGNPVERREGFLVINIEVKEEGKDSIKNIEEKINRIMKKKGSAPQINTCLIGWLDGKLKDREWCDRLQSAFRAIDALVVDKLEDQHFVSYTGFSPDILNWVQIGRQRINLNMAMRYSQYDNRTYITIGSPIITREY